MLLHPRAQLNVAPDFAAIDDAIVALGPALIDCGFEPTRSRAVVDRYLDACADARSFVASAAPVTGGHLFAREALVPPVVDWIVTLTMDGAASDEPRAVELAVARDQLRPVLELVRSIVGGDRRSDVLDRLSSDHRELIAPFLRDESARTPPHNAVAPGIYRREHACLLVRSRTTGILLDPVRLLGPVARSGGLLTEHADAVLVTHGHEDHWDLPSLLEVTHSRSLPVYVPRVPEPTLLSRSTFVDALGAADQAGGALDWHATLQVGDIEVFVLPFFGEQPTRDGPGALAGVRSWGNCFVLRTPTFSALVLVDSGADPLGDMRDVVKDHVARHGPVDVVLSCLREFASPFFGGLESYWATLSFERLRELHDQWRRGCLPSTTAGPKTVAELCRIAGARFFLPYAHGYCGLGIAIDDVSWGDGEPSEAELLGRVAKSCRSVGAETDPIAWNPGDAVTFASPRQLALTQAS